MQIYWNKRERLHKKRVQLPKDFLGTPTWPPFHCFGTIVTAIYRVLFLSFFFIFSCLFIYLFVHYRTPLTTVFLYADGVLPVKIFAIIIVVVIIIIIIIIIKELGI